MCVIWAAVYTLCLYMYVLHVVHRLLSVCYSVCYSVHMSVLEIVYRLLSVCHSVHMSVLQIVHRLLSDSIFCGWLQGRHSLLPQLPRYCGPLQT